MTMRPQTHGTLAMCCVFGLAGLVASEADGQVHSPTPVFTPAPVYTPPVYRPEPIYRPEPVYRPEPIYRPEPVYSPEPVQRPEPVYRPEPGPVVVRPPREEPEHEKPDCSVKELECSYSCYPLPWQWSTRRECFRNQCEIKEENCLEKLLHRKPGENDQSKVTFHVRSDYRYIVEVEFYSQDRNWIWPGNGQTYNVDDYKTHSYSLTCRVGEKICYGAWGKGGDTKYWGVGRNGERGCTNCCTWCDGGAVSVVIE
jgi:hypothetical protein